MVSDPMNTSYAFYFGKAVLWSGAAAAFVTEVLLQGEIDRLVVGFIAGLAFSYVMAFFHHGAKERFGRGFVSFSN